MSESKNPFPKSGAMFDRPPMEEWIHLKQYGYAPGDYLFKCSRCHGEAIGDKRAWCCRSCAEELHALTLAGQLPSFAVSERDGILIQAIVDRYVRIKAAVGEQADRLQAAMDVTACHANGAPLDLVQLLTSREEDFLHDLAGIRDNIDTATGGLLNLFSPRSALQAPQPTETKTIVTCYDEENGRSGRVMLDGARSATDVWDACIRWYAGDLDNEFATGVRQALDEGGPKLAGERFDLVPLVLTGVLVVATPYGVVDATEETLNAEEGET